MKPAATILCVEPDRCRIGLIGAGRARTLTVDPAPLRAPGAEPETDAQPPQDMDNPWRPLAAAAVEAMRAEGTTPGELVLAIPSAWCFCGLIESVDGGSTGRLNRHRRESLLYELEERLPVAAEQVAADFWPLATGWLGVAVPLDRVGPLIAALEDRGLAVASACPLAVLVLQNCRADGGVDVLMVGDDRHIDLFWFENNAPAGWSWLPQTAEDIAAWLGLLPVERGSEPLRIAARGVSPRVIDELAASDRYQWAAPPDGPPETPPEELPGQGLPEAAMVVAGDILKGRVRPMIDLRRDARLRGGGRRWLDRPLRALAAAAIVFLLVSIGVMLYGADRYDRQTRVFEQQQREVFERTFPDSRMPRRVSRRLESELATIRSGEGSGVEQLRGAADRSALHTLARTFDRLPDISSQGADPAIAFGLERIILEGDRLRLEGRAPSHNDAGQLAAALGRDGRLDIQPPRTQALPDGQVSFVITGRERSDAPGGSP